MANCPIQSRERLEALLAGRLPEDERRALQAHLAEPCERCLELFESLDEAELLDLHAPPEAALSAQEADRIFAAACPAPAPGWRERLRALLRWPVLAPAAAALAVGIAALIFLLQPAPRSPESAPGYTGVKSAGAEIVESLDLIGLVGRIQDGRPTVVRPARDGEALVDGEVLLLRVRVSQPAWVSLFGETGRSLIPIYAFDRQLEAGEHELAASGSALAIQPGQLGSRARLIGIACPARVPSEAVQRAEQIVDPRLRAELLPGCAAATLRLRAGEDEAP
ncbi:MAG: zf-HC2 domain-containing protein [Deltaproteobacteria bacterium]|nr:zf-HC2 domain-containing protein [Deltaproteobacteria bacterium]